MERLDLSFCRGAIDTFESELFDCRFDSAKLTGLPRYNRRFNRRFERCSFRNATLTALVLGPHIVDCDFTRAEARKLDSAPNTIFERCTFNAADLSGATFNDTTFIDCTFEGTVFSASTTFERCSLNRTTIGFGIAQVSRSKADGTDLPDQWEGEAEEEAAHLRYLEEYARAAAAGRIGLDRC